jgi:hypothetical protein
MITIQAYVKSFLILRCFVHETECLVLCYVQVNFTQLKKNSVCKLNDVTTLDIKRHLSGGKKRMNHCHLNFQSSSHLLRFKTETLVRNAA